MFFSLRFKYIIYDIIYIRSRDPLYIHSRNNFKRQKVSQIYHCGTIWDTWFLFKNCHLTL